MVSLSAVNAQRTEPRENLMQIPKQQILDLLKSRGDNAEADRADTELPEQVDTDQHRGLLSKLGINPADLLGGGGLAGKLGL